MTRKIMIDAHLLLAVLSFPIGLGGLSTYFGNRLQAIPPSVHLFLAVLIASTAILDLIPNALELVQDGHTVCVTVASTALAVQVFHARLHRSDRAALGSAAKDDAESSTSALQCQPCDETPASETSVDEGIGRDMHTAKTSLDCRVLAHSRRCECHRTGHEMVERKTSSVKTRFLLVTVPVVIHVAMDSLLIGLIVDWKGLLTVGVPISLCFAQDTLVLSVLLRKLVLRSHLVAWGILSATMAATVVSSKILIEKATEFSGAEGFVCAVAAGMVAPMAMELLPATAGEQGELALIMWTALCALSYIDV